MPIQKLITPDNLGKGFKADTGRRKYDVDLNDYVDNLSVYIKNGVLKSTAPLYLGNTFSSSNRPLNLDRIRATGIDFNTDQSTLNLSEKWFLQKLRALYDHVGDVYLVNNSGSRTATNLVGYDNYGDLSTKLQQANPKDKELTGSILRIRNFALGDSRKRIYGEYGPSGPVGDEIEQEIVFWNEERGTDSSPSSFNGVQTKIHKFTRIGTVDLNEVRRVVTDYTNRTVVEVVATNPSINIIWTEWHYEALDVAPEHISAAAAASRNYTAGKGLTLTGDEFKANVLTHDANALSLTVNGALAAKTVGGIVQVRSNILFTAKSSLTAANNYVGWFNIASTPTFMSPYTITPQDGGASVNYGMGSLGRMRVTYTITEGKDLIQEVKLMTNGIYASNSAASDPKFNEMFAAPTMNVSVRNFNYDSGAGTISYEVENLSNMNALPVLIAFKVDTSSMGAGTNRTIRATADSEVLDAGILARTHYATTNQGFSVTYNRP